MGKKDLATETEKSQINGQFDNCKPIRKVKDNRIKEMLARKVTLEAVRKYQQGRTNFKYDPELDKKIKGLQQQLEKKK